MHVAFIITRGDAVGGATIHVRDMAAGLLRRNQQATVLVGGEGAARQEFERNGIRCVPIRRLERKVRPLRDAAAIVDIAGALRKLKPDLVSTHTSKAGWLGRAASRLCGIPAMFTPHGWSISDRLSPRQGRVFRLAEKLAAPLAASIVNVCAAERTLAERHGIAPPRKLAVIHNGVTDLDPQFRAHPETQPPHLVMVARFEAPKDAPVLLYALSLLHGLPWTMEFVGDGPGLPGAQSLVKELGLEARVLFSGATPEVAERLSRAQIFVLASRSEGFPRSILEAMRAGLPVVASDVGGVSEAVVDGESGYVVPRDHVRYLADALRLLIEDPERRVRFGNFGRRRFEAEFTFERTFEATYALYHQVLNREWRPEAMGAMQ